MTDLESVRDRFFAALDDYDLPACEAILQAARTTLIDAGQALWLDYLQAILFTEQSPPRWDLAATTLAEILTATPPPKLRARVYLERAIVADYTGQYAQAIADNKDALALFTALGDVVYAAKILKNSGIAHTHAYEYGTADEHALHEAIRCHQQALTMLQDRDEEQLTASIEAELGTVYKSLGRWADALDAYRAQAEKYRRFGWLRKLFLTLNNMGEIYHKQVAWTEAIQHYEEALALLAGLPADDPYEEADILANLALSHWQAGDIETARQASNAAIGIIEEIRDPLATETTRRGFFGTRIRIYEERIGLELSVDEVTTALSLLERAKSRTFIELLAGHPAAAPVNIGGAAGHEADSLQRVNPLNATAIQARLPTDSVLLEYFVNPEEAHLFVVTHDSIETIALSPTLHRALLNTFAPDQLRLARIEPDSNGRLHQPWPLATLHKLLIAPAADSLRDFERICIIPHGPLHYVPFHALSAQNDALSDEVERVNELIYAPSATVLLDYCQKKPPGRGAGVLAFGHGKDLPFAQIEVETITDLVGGRRYVGDKVTLDTVIEAAERYPWVHFACHGLFDPDAPMQSGLDLADGRLDANMIMDRLQLHADLVVLSGCETGKSRLYNGDELVGLVRAFIYAGAPTVLVSLWQTDDLATRLLMNRFYHELMAGFSPGRALAHAQRFLRVDLDTTDLLARLREDGLDQRQAVERVRRLLAADGFDLNQPIGAQRVFRHPYYWAPFLVIGDRLNSPL